MSVKYLVSYGTVELVDGRWSERETVELAFADGNEALGRYDEWDPRADYRATRALCRPRSAMDGRGFYKRLSADPGTGAEVIAYCRWDSGREKLWEAEREAERYADVSIFVPECGEAIRISEGDGGNLLEEDIEQGWEDYVYYDVFDGLGEEECGGGMVLLPKPFRTMFYSTEDAVCDVLAQRYGRPDVGFVALGFRKGGDPDGE